MHWLVETRKIKISSNHAWKMTICFNMSNGIHVWHQPAIKRLKKAVNRSVFEYVNYSLKREINSGNQLESRLGQYIKTVWLISIKK